MPCQNALKRCPRYAGDEPPVPENWHRRLLCARGDRRSDCRTNSSFDEIAASHYSPQGSGARRCWLITSGICDQRNGVQPSVCTAAILSPAHVRFRYKADIAGQVPPDVRYSPKSGHSPPRSPCPLSAKRRHRQARVRERPQSAALAEWGCS